MLTFCRGLRRGLLGRALPSLAVLGLLAAPGVMAAPRTHYLVIYNDGGVPVLSVEVAPHGTTDFQQLNIQQPLADGRIAHTTATSPDGACSMDLRVTYPGSEPSMTVTEWDLCRNRTVHLGMARRAALASPAA